MLDPVPLGGPWRQVADRDLPPGLGRQPGQLGLPGPDPVAVAAASIGTDQQPVGLGAGEAADLLPPAPQGGDREPGGVVVGPDTDPAGVAAKVIDAIGIALPSLGVGEVMHVDPLGLARGAATPGRR
jgi:hypothetical protein